MISLKLIKKSKDVDLNKGINILYKYIPVNLCIDSNELSHWIDNYNNAFNDKMYCFVIKNDNIVIGWLQFTHFINKFIFLDYLIVEKEYRNSNTMKNIYEMIRYECKKLQCESVVLECGFEMNQHDAIVRLYEIFGFKKFNINYIEPKVNINLFTKKICWSEIPSILMHNDNTLDMQDVIQTIYFNHYLRWYSFYKLDMSDYKKFLNEIINKTSNYKIIELNDNYIDYVFNIVKNRNWNLSDDEIKTEINRWLINADNSICYIGILNNKPISVGVFDTISDKILGNYSSWNMLLWVEPEYRGRNYGYMITQKRIEHAKNLGLNRIYLDTINALYYHIKFGWKVIDSVIIYDKLTYIMEKEI